VIVAAVADRGRAADDTLPQTFFQTVHISAHIVHATRLKELFDHAIESQLLVFGTKRLSVALKLCAELVRHEVDLCGSTALGLTMVVDANDCAKPNEARSLHGATSVVTATTQTFIGIYLNAALYIDAMYSATGP
jgi:hypothetical protein